MKTIVLGDIHGRTVWKTIMDREQPDRVVFLGDYVSSHEDIGADQQIDNFMEILVAKEQQPQKFVLLRGNHDLQHLGYWWAECSGLDRKVQQHMSEPAIRERFLTCSQWIYEMKTNWERIVCSHSGISKVWMEQHDIRNVADINLEPPSPVFSFTPASFFDMDGNSICQPCVWIRPSALTESAIQGYTQIVGHTPVKSLYQHKMKDTDNSLWFCDTLGLDIPEYLVIEDGICSTGKLSGDAGGKGIK